MIFNNIRNICDILLLFLGQIYENVCRKSKRCFKHSFTFVSRCIWSAVTIFHPLSALIYMDRDPDEDKLYQQRCHGVVLLPHPVPRRQPSCTGACTSRDVVRKSIAKGSIVHEMRVSRARASRRRASTSCQYHPFGFSHSSSFVGLLYKKLRWLQRIRSIKRLKKVES